jgi:hypothetical protein
MRKVGRNDPCPCGSGKKYKHCCLRKDRRGNRRRSATAQPVTTLEDVQRMMRRAPRDMDPQLRAEMEELMSMAAYEQEQEAIEAASQTLEAYQDEFDDLMSDPIAALMYAERLFAEDQFSHLRYTPDDVQEAFEQVGYPRIHRVEPAPEDIRTLHAAMLYLVEGERVPLARRLLLFLPELVDAGRYMDAWMIQLSAVQMTEMPEQSNPFLTTMFFLAFSEWQEWFKRD